jgi:hypothetical protein
MSDQSPVIAAGLPRMGLDVVLPRKFVLRGPRADREHGFIRRHFYPAEVATLLNATLAETGICPFKFYLVGVEARVTEWFQKELQQKLEFRLQRAGRGVQADLLLTLKGGTGVVIHLSNVRS